MKATHSLLATIVAAQLLAACGPAHVQPFQARQRKYEQGKYAALEATHNAGSLWSSISTGILRDTRASQVGDVVTILIDEEAAAQGDASTKLGKSSSAQEGLSNVLGLLPALKRSNPELDANNLLSFLSKSEFSGAGATTRKGALNGNIAVRITREMPNGDLFLEGTKVLLLNHEEYHLYVSGIVRPLDVSRQNTIASSKVADAQIEFTGRGDVDGSTSQGWFAKALSYINPF
jgi:flagellar L-ring protein precursor FlgH